MAVLALVPVSGRPSGGCYKGVRPSTTTERTFHVETLKIVKGAMPREDVAQERFGPTTRSKNRAVDRDASEQALADATIRLWRDLWQRAHAPCPRCGTVRR